MALLERFRIRRNQLRQSNALSVQFLERFRLVRHGSAPTETAPGSQPDQSVSHPRRRAAWLDAARGVALAAMLVYHLAFDLMLFGYVDWPVNSDPAWRAFAAGIASSFLFLSGVSLAYAHARPFGSGEGGAVFWRPFLRRLAVLAAAAGAVTVATAIAMPAPVYFGILHAIALFSLLALPLRHLHPVLAVALAIVVFVLPAVWRDPVFYSPWLYPVGLAPTGPFTFDYEPIFPWFGAFLLGVVAGRGLPRGGAIAPGAWRPIAWAGRHSLILYLIHQPILFGGLIALRHVIG